MQKIVDDKKPVKIYTINGFQMVGTIIRDFGDCLIVEHDNKLSVVFYHAISTIEVKK